MEGLSRKEIEIISKLEFDEKYFFTAEDIDKYAKNKTQRYNLIKNLVKKGRIIKINRHKFYLIPIKAKSGSWSEHPFVIADEILDGKDYVIGGWAAANYWKLTDQIPFQVDIWTTRRQGKIEIMNARFVFHRSTKKKVDNHSIQEIENHKFKIMPIGESKKWIKSRV